MIFSKDVKNLFVYKRQMFLPTLENSSSPNKKKNSAIFLVTPNRQSSMNLMKHPLLVNRFRYRSYYIERDLSYYIGTKSIEQDEPVDEASYIYESVESKDIIQYTGFEKDVSVLKSVFDEEDYKNVLGDIGTNVVPTLILTVGDFPSIDEYFSFFVTEVDGNTRITIHLPRYNGSESYDNYARKILNFIYKAVYITINPDQYGTANPSIFADTLTGADTRYADQPMNTAFGELYERGPLTLENIGKKFKYASTSKFKRKFSLKLNTLKRVLNKVQGNFGVQMNLPSIGSPSVGSPNTAPTSNESAITSNYTEFDKNCMRELEEGSDYITLGNSRVLFLNESNSNAQLRKILYYDRLRTRKQVLDIYKEVKNVCPFISFTFPELSKYGQKNLFVDLYYYNEAYFRNSTYTLRRGFNIYFDLLYKLINDPRITSAGYTNKTIFIPVKDWNRNNKNRMWLFREDINPISIIYQLMFADPGACKRTFGNSDIFFFDNNRYFKLNFSEFKDNNDIKKASMKFKLFISRFISNMNVDPEDEDQESNTSETPEVIRTHIYDKIETAKGVDLTGKEKANTIDTKNIYKVLGVKRSDTAVPSVELKSLGNVPTSVNKNVEELNNSKDTIYTKSVDKEKQANKIRNLQKLASRIDDISKQATDVNDAINIMDDEEELKKILLSIDNFNNNGVDIDATRASRINDVNNQLLDKEIKGVKIKDLLGDNPDEKEIPTVSLDIASPNEEWKDMTYMNFDKSYNLDRDIVACFKHFSQGVKYPITILDINVEDTSTSEDRKDTYTVKVETFNGDRQTIKLDIPTIIDNRFLLRGNSKVISTQFLNMPILKTDRKAAQIITNYNKIFVYIFRDTIGRSNPIASRVIKTLTKYKGNGLKIEYGDNRRICFKYQLPLDYIDIASVIGSIEVKKTKIKLYFNQDQFREEYPNIDDTLGVPYAVKLDTKEILYINSMHDFFAQQVVNVLSSDKDFMQSYDKQRATSVGTYVTYSILNKRIPAILVLAFSAGLENVLKRANIDYHLQETINNEIRLDPTLDYIRFEDGYLVYRLTYLSSLLLNGLKDCPVGTVSMADINKRSTYVEFLDAYGGRFKADGLENFIDCLIDPITKEVLEHYKLPTDYIGVMLYAAGLMADNKYIKHTDTSSRRIRRAELIAAYTYEVLSDAYGKWATELRRGRSKAAIIVKQSAVIDKILQSPISQDDSINNALGAVEETNNIAYKGKAGLNSDRSYSLDKRTYDESMLNVMAGSTNFSASSGITRTSTINMNVEGVRGYVKQIDSDTSKMNSVNTLSATEAMIPFEATNDDNTRVLMSYIQTAKHQVRVAKSDPLLITSGADEALAYLTTNKFATKSDYSGKVLSVDNDKIIIEYDNGKKDYVDLKGGIEKNSDGGYYVPLSRVAAKNIKPGYKFKQGEVLAYDPESFSNTLGESDHIAYNVGTIAKVAILNSDEGFEDSGICTNKLSNYLTTQIVYKFEHVVEKDATIHFIVKKGTYVNVGDPLLIWQDPYTDDDINVALRVMSKGDVSTLGRRVVESETTGTIVDIKIFRTCELDEMSESVRSIVKAYENPINKLKKELDSYGINTKSLPATYALPPTGKLKKAEKAIYVEIYVQHPDIPGVGDKVTYFAANKATLRAVIEKGKEPYTDFRPDEEVSAMLSVSSINKRMVTSILTNGALNKLMIELDRTIKDKLGIPYDVNNL